ncbi:unnamed protein product [Clonostachys rosea]|uniref:Rhodopsin domain-containing protein n=1 Tax=Bionectria ochroleuca TaxID=29856 RepID=A0ABY6U6J2_BIOOC|nr:unnamed protein product [Clonostachys rosea]
MVYAGFSAPSFLKVILRKPCISSRPSFAFMNHAKGNVFMFLEVLPLIFSAILPIIASTKSSPHLATVFFFIRTKQHISDTLRAASRLTMRNLTQDALENFVVCVAMIALSGLMILLRMLLRISIGRKLFLSDCLCIASFVVFVGYAALIINHIFNVSNSGAFGIMFLGSPKITLQESLNFIKVMSWITELLFTTSITLAKLSILTLYWTLFSISEVCKKSIIGAIALSVAWFITFILLIIFQCKPINTLWTHPLETELCISTPIVLLTVEITNLVIDIIILSIPVYIISSLRLSTFKKWSILGLFLLGARTVSSFTILFDHGLTCSLSTFLHVVKPAPTFLWSTIQLGSAIVCACLPTLGPIFSRNTMCCGFMRNKTDISIAHGASNHQNRNHEAWWVNNLGEGQYNSFETIWPTHEDYANMHSDEFHLSPLPPQQI